MIIEGTVASLPNEAVSDGDAKVLLGKMKELIVSQMHGEHYTATHNGRVFVGNQLAAGAVLPIYSNTTQQCGIFNPLGSGVNAVPLKLNITYVSTTGAAGGFCLGYKTGCGGSIATGSTGITAATLITPINMSVGQWGSKVYFMSAAITTGAPGILMQLGINQMVLTAADATLSQWKADYKFDGYPEVTPGNAIFVAGNIATLITATCSIIWEESPV